MLWTTEWQGLELVCPTLDVKSQAFPGLTLYRYMDVGIPPSTGVLPRVQPPQGFLSSQRGLSPDPIGRLCATFGTFGILTNIFCFSGHWSRLTVSLFLLWTGGADTTFHINRLFAPGQQPARCSIYRAIVICEMSDPWPDMMTKFIISPVKSSTGNKLLRGVIREGCLVVAWDTVISLSYHQDH